MEIREILETNLVSNNLEVKFRIDEDTDEVIRTYTFDLACKRGILVEIIGTTPTSTITWR